MSKTCPVCKLEKEHSEFYTRRTGAGNAVPSSRCKECYKTPEYRAAANARNKKYENGKRSEYYKKNPLKYLWDIAKKRANKTGRDFSIEPEDIVFTGFCPITGVELDTKNNKQLNSISLDRKDNTKGYVKGNVFAISRWANLRKSDMSVQDIKSILNYMEANNE